MITDQIQFNSVTVKGNTALIDIRERTFHFKRDVRLSKIIYAGATAKSLKE
jgi:hypothetical protein